MRIAPTLAVAILLIASASYAQPVPVSKPVCSFPLAKAIPCDADDTGVLQFTDCYYSSGFQNYNYDYWTFSGIAGQSVLIYAETSESLFDPRVAAYRPNGTLAGVGDDYLFNSDTDLLEGVLDSTGTWTIMLTTESPIFTSKNYYLQLLCSTVAPPTAPCAPDSTTACLLNGRFRVTVRFRAGFDNAPTDTDALVKSVTGFADPSYETAFFYFNSPNNIEMLVKMLDQGNKDSQGRPTIAVLFGTATPLRIELTITDTETGATRHYTSEFAKMQGRTDFTAFLK